ncbi:uncharacterized protein LOC119353751 [Triticum dicoccoides]|uniref:uncharacterized protein LOC119353751 n=1 Tax=Triticum dicoccoides TaxID=85692 RepID=UPI00188ED906|nr:uncharacterized protein LOC119353751 [Triticum dicoccoides]
MDEVTPNLIHLVYIYCPTLEIRRLVPSPAASISHLGIHLHPISSLSLHFLLVFPSRPTTVVAQILQEPELLCPCAYLSRSFHGAEAHLDLVVDPAAAGEQQQTADHPEQQLGARAPMAAAGRLVSPGAGATRGRPCCHGHRSVALCRSKSPPWNRISTVPGPPRASRPANPAGASHIAALTIDALLPVHLLCFRSSSASQRSSSSIDCVRRRIRVPHTPICLFPASSSCSVDVLAGPPPPSCLFPSLLRTGGDRQSPLTASAWAASSRSSSASASRPAALTGPKPMVLLLRVGSDNVVL